MLPIASSSGPAIIAVVVVAAGLFLSWLLRMEKSDGAALDDEREADGDR